MAQYGATREAYEEEGHVGEDERARRQVKGLLDGWDTKTLLGTLILVFVVVTCVRSTQTLERNPAKALTVMIGCFAMVCLVLILIAKYVSQASAQQRRRENGQQGPGLGVGSLP